MPLRSLLLTRDDQVIRVFRRVLEDLQIEMELCTSAARAAAALARHKYDAVIIDCDDVKGASEVLRGLRRTASNKTSTAFAIIHDRTSVRRAFEIGANLALEKPITADRARHSFSATYGIALQERRRYFRYPVEMTITVRFEQKGGHREFHGAAYNLSEGGMAIKAKQSLQDQTGGLATLIFVLPGTHDWIETHGRIAWADGEGHAGIRFEKLPLALRESLQKWFTEMPDEDAAAQPAKAAKPRKRSSFS